MVSIKRGDGCHVMDDPRLVLLLPGLLFSATACPVFPLADSPRCIIDNKVSNC